MTDVRLAFGGKPLFEGVSFTLAKGERAALVGRNGAGKSTLMRLITGRHEPDDGELWIHPGTMVTTVEQEPDLSAFETVLDYATSGGADAWRAEAELGHFGVDPSADPKILSGGQTRRAALAKAFAYDPDILLLDEPTNHLDVPMIETLESRLIGFNGAVLLVSHDRRFMENVTTNTLWLRDGVVLKSPKGYGDFERWAEEIEEAEIRQLEKIKTQLKAEEHWLQRGVTGRRARNMGRLHRLKGMRAEAQRRKAAIVAQKAKAGISAEEAGHQSRKVIETFGLTKAYGDLKIVEGLDFKILRGDRVGFIGPNGVGKTTLLKLLLDELERDSGNVKLNPALRITYLDQTRDTLRPKDTLWEALAPQGGDSIMVQGKQRHVAAYAKDFLFKTDQLRQAVSALSGGERNRLTLAIALAQSTDVLVLDEPTNDLDMQTLDLLEDMLMNFEGTLILVSHDRAFLDATVTSCLVPLGDGKWVETAGGWTDAQSQIKGKPGKAATAEKKAKAVKPKSTEPKKQTKLSFKDQHRLKEVETEMPRLEAEIAELESKLSDPNLFNNNPDEFNRINKRLETARTALEQTELDWMEIEEKKEALATS
ncbi:MAG: ABC-F family ATP-binding cassette domain-containing protein [Henriciella sp.]|nr:ABC-F family ATP-binding cassette domain-containing protein [Henriciella sp.]